MINAYQLSAGFDTLTAEKPEVSALRAAEWRKERNAWMRSQGIGGIVKDGKRSKSIPNWWPSTSEFWFTDEEKEAEFLRNYK